MLLNTGSWPFCKKIGFYKRSTFYLSPLSENMWCSSFCVWLISLNRITSSLQHAASSLLSRIHGQQDTWKLSHLILKTEKSEQMKQDDIAEQVYSEVSSLYPQAVTSHRIVGLALTFNGVQHLGKLPWFWSTHIESTIALFVGELIIPWEKHSLLWIVHQEEHLRFILCKCISAPCSQYFSPCI